MDDISFKRLLKGWPATDGIDGRQLLLTAELWCYGILSAEQVQRVIGIIGDSVMAKTAGAERFDGEVGEQVRRYCDSVAGRFEADRRALEVAVHTFDVAKDQQDEALIASRIRKIAEASRLVAPESIALR